jgi:hypothetical protein
MRLAEVSRTVSASVQINLEYGEALGRKPTRLHRRHAARLVHFFGKRMNVYDATTGLAAGWRVQHAEALTRLYGEKEGLEH